MADENKTPTVVKDTSLQVVGIGAIGTGLALLQKSETLVMGIVVTLVGVGILALYTKGYIGRE